MARMPKPTNVRKRIEDGMREVGILLIAFAPLDAVLAEPNRIPLLLLFLLVGVFLFTVAILLEGSDAHGQRHQRR